MVRSAIAFAEYGPLIKSSALPETAHVYTSQYTGTSALSSNTSTNDFVIVRRNRSVIGAPIPCGEEPHQESSPESQPKTNRRSASARPPYIVMPQYSSERRGLSCAGCTGESAGGGYVARRNSSRYTSDQTKNARKIGSFIAVVCM